MPERESHFQRDIRNLLTGRMRRPFTPGRLTRDGIGGTLLNLGPVVPRIAGNVAGPVGKVVGEAVGGIVEVSGGIVSARRSRRAEKATGELKRNPAQVRVPLLLKIADWILPEESMLPRLQRWQENVNQQVDQYIAVAKKRKKGEIAHGIGFTALNTVVEAGATIVANAHAGLGLLAVTHPEVWGPALAAAGPIGWAFLAATAVLSGIAGVIGVRYYNNLIKRYTDEKDQIVEEAGQAMRDFSNVTSSSREKQMEERLKTLRRDHPFLSRVFGGPARVFLDRALQGYQAPQ